MKKILLDKEETQLEKEIEKGGWVEVPDMENEIKKHQLYAQNRLGKHRKINIRMTDWDYNKVKMAAIQEGIPYQTLISSLIHKYLTGRVKMIK